MAKMEPEEVPSHEPGVIRIAKNVGNFFSSLFASNSSVASTEKVLQSPIIFLVYGELGAASAGFGPFSDFYLSLEKYNAYT